MVTKTFGWCKENDKLGGENENTWFKNRKEIL